MSDIVAFTCALRQPGKHTEGETRHPPMRMAPHDLHHIPTHFLHRCWRLPRLRCSQLLRDHLQLRNAKVSISKNRSRSIQKQRDQLTAKTRLFFNTILFYHTQADAYKSWDVVGGNFTVVDIFFLIHEVIFVFLSLKQRVTSLLLSFDCVEYHSRKSGCFQRIHSSRRSPETSLLKSHRCFLLCYLTVWNITVAKVDVLKNTFQQKISWNIAVELSK